MKEFYVTLISNSSLDLYPSNHASSFKVQLPRKISIPENTVVALAETQYQYNFFNVCENNNRFSYSNGKTIREDYVDIRQDYVEPGFYDNVNEILLAVVEKTKQYFGDWLKYDKSTNRVKVVRSDPQNNQKFIFHGRLALQLGFVPGEDVFQHKISPNVGNVYFGIPDQMLIYCDIIEPQLIGYESTQVIKIVNTTHSEVKFGTPCHRDFHRLHYIPVMKSEFDTVEINIRDITGELFPFRHGIVTVKLHFMCREGGERTQL